MLSDEKDMIIQEGDCFGWYSSVSVECQPNSCTQAERCKQYTLTLQKSGSGASLIQELQEFRNKVDKPEPKKSVDTSKLLAKTYFDQVSNIMKTLVEHEETTSNDFRLSLKKKNRNVAMVFKKKDEIEVIIGSPQSEDCKKHYVKIGADINEVKKELTEFVGANT